MLADKLLLQKRKGKTKYVRVLQENEERQGICFNFTKKHSSYLLLDQQGITAAGATPSKPWH